MMKDLRLALRSLVRSPALTVIAVVTLALGIGATTAVFSVVDGVLVRSLPFLDAERLVRVYASKPSQQIDRAGLAGADFVDFREKVEAFEYLGSWQYFGLSLGEERPRELSTILVTPGMLTELATPLHGRGFLPEEGQPGQSRAVVVSHALFESELGGDPDVVGTELILDGEAYRVVGVMGSDFRFPGASGTEIWAPRAFDPAQLDRRAHWWNATGKLSPGTTLEQAQAEASNLARSLEEQFPDTNEGWGVTIVPLKEQMVGRVRPALTSLLIAVGLVLLIACANVANLLLARGLSRQGELALRASLGASRGRLLRQLLTESVVLALAGGALGVLLARLFLSGLAAAAPVGLPRLSEISLDGRVLLFALGATLSTGIVFGLVPALRLTGKGLAGAIRDGGRGTDRSGGLRLRGLLAVAQLALSLLLLIGAGLMLRSFLRLVDVDPGFRVEERVAIQLFVYGDRYQEPESQRVFFERLYEEIESVPGVQSVSGVSSLPMGQLGGGGQPIQIEGRAEPEEQQPGVRIASRGYFETMGMQLRAGRFFGDEDRDGGVPVTVINESAARQYFGEEAAVGKRFMVGEASPGEEREPVTVVGVVSDTRFIGMSEDPIPEIYIPFEQSVTGAMSVVVATEGPPAALQTALEDRVWKVDPAQPIWRTVTLETLIREDTAQSRFYARLIMLFAGVALVLAAIGLYGVISYSVAQRTREIGIRMAIGARTGDILGRVLRDGSSMILVGLGLGLLLGLGLTIAFSKLLSGLLFEVSPTDPPTFIGVSLVLVAVGLLACLIPAWRASRVNPIRALHYE